MSLQRVILVILLQNVSWRNYERNTSYISSVEELAQTHYDAVIISGLMICFYNALFGKYHPSMLPDEVTFLTSIILHAVTSFSPLSLKVISAAALVRFWNV